jgi:membrane protein YqaA with SNARE-associated domain
LTGRDKPTEDGRTFSDGLNSSPDNKKYTRKTVILRILALILVIGISVFIYLIRGDAEKLLYYGYPGIFILSFLAYATVFLPAPGIAIIFTLAGLGNFNWVLVGIIAGAGAVLGETVGYLAGFSGQGIIENKGFYLRISNWFQKNVALTILILSTIPNPFFDFVGILAGAFRIPVLSFLFWCWIGETLKMLTFSFLGVNFFDILQKLIIR